MHVAVRITQCLTIKTKSMLASGIIKHVLIFANKVFWIIVCTALPFYISREDGKQFLIKKCVIQGTFKCNEKVVNHSRAITIKQKSIMIDFIAFSEK